MNLRRLLVLLLAATLAEAGLADTFITGVTVATDNGAALRLDNPNARNASFNADLKQWQRPGRIAKCSTLIDVPVGTAHGNDSFGGICTLVEDGKKNSVKICDDEMIGHFRIEKVNRKITLQELVDFTVSNCYGG